MKTETSRRSTVAFAVGNLVAVLVLGVALFALPVRFLWADLLVGAALLGATGASGTALYRDAWAPRALRVAALALLGIGLLVIAAALLSLAYLSGIHGDYGRGGVLLMVLVAFLALPYLVVFPVIELLWLHARRARA